MTIGIYAIVNKTNGDRYIGSSANIESRWQRHIQRLRKNNHHSIHMQRAWNKFGEEQFEFIILFQCELDNLLDIEQEYIDNHRPEYNISPTAGRTAGVIRTEEYRKKQSKSQSGKTVSDETRKKISQGMKGKKNSLGVHRSVSDETKKKISNKLKGHPVSVETIEKIKNNVTPWMHTEEAKRRIGAAAKGNKYAASGKKQELENGKAI